VEQKRVKKVKKKKKNDEKFSKSNIKHPLNS